jgi:HSP20 family protein
MVEKSHTAGWFPNIYEPFRQMGQRVADWFAPRSDASAMENFYEVNLELPGVKSEDVDVSVHGNSLTVRGLKNFEREETGRTYFFSEREFGSFERTFRLPADADSENIDASFADGILCVKIAKKSARKTEAKKIAVRNG